MKASLLFVASLAVAIISLCGVSGTAVSQTTTASGGTALLPNVVVEAPKHLARPQHLTHRGVARNTVSPRTSPSTPTPSSSPVLARLAQLASASGSCVGGCQTSFRSGDAPWHGCSLSSGTLSSTCRNVGNYKTYNECMEASLVTGWRTNEITWYCSSLALK
ncbi:MAG: hypothetical protein E7813_13825 [Bradyrhizobium sp.]|nr:MAG: hypothetical protein E7813_13825 [Bradyrhizobium sp.]